MKKQVSEGSLHKWFKGSKSKDGKGGWVNVVTGGTCASDEPGEGTPKCVSSSKRASMSKSERLSAARRKKKADPGQQQKSGAAKPTYVSTDKKKKKMKESYTRALTPLSEKAQKCWKGYEKKGTKKMFGKTYNNCVKKEEVELVDEAKYEKGASDYGKTSIRNKRAFGKGGNAADPKERGGAKMLRHDSHTKRRGVKKNNKYGATNKPPVDGAPSDEFKKDRYASMRTEAKVDMKTPDYKRATVRDKRYGNPHGSHELGGGIRKDRRADHEARRGVKKEEIEMTRKAYNKLHKDFKSDDPKNPRTTKYVKGKGTISAPVKFVDEGMLVNVAKGVESGVKKFNKFDDKVTKAAKKKVSKVAAKAGKNIKKGAKKVGMAALRGTAGAVGGALKGAYDGAKKGIKKGMREQYSDWRSEFEQIDERKRNPEHKEASPGSPKGYGDSPVRKSKIDHHTDRKEL